MKRYAPAETKSDLCDHESSIFTIRSVWNKETWEVVVREECSDCGAYMYSVEPVGLPIGSMHPGSYSWQHGENASMEVPHG